MMMARGGEEGDFLDDRWGCWMNTLEFAEEEERGTPNMNGLSGQKHQKNAEFRHFTGYH